MNKFISGAISLIIALAVILVNLPVDAYAFAAGEGTLCEAYEQGFYIGSDGKHYTYPETSAGMSHLQYIVYEGTGNVSYYQQDIAVDSSTATGARPKLYLRDSGDSSKHVYCIEAGIPLGTGTDYKAENETNNDYFRNLPPYIQLGIKFALIYGWDEGKESPVAGTTADDYAFATQTIIWEYQQQLRSDAGARHNNQWGVPGDMYYLALKDRPAEKCYDWILEKISNHGKIPSFTSASRAGAPSYVLKYNSSTGRYETTLTDTNNTGYPIKTDVSSGFNVTRNGNQYTFYVTDKHEASTNIAYKKQINVDELPFLVWGAAGKQTVCTGVDDPVQFYMSLSTEQDGKLKIIKESEDSNNSGISFKVSGNGINMTVTTGTDGTLETTLIPGNYTVTELNPADKYVSPASQTVTVAAGNTTTVNFSNILKKWKAEVTKKDKTTGIPQADATLAGAEYGLYMNGVLIDTYITDENGKFTTKEYVCGNYTLKEIKASEGYLLDDTEYPVGAESSNFTLEHNVITLTVPEEIIKGSILIVKHADNGDTQIETPEVGAKFEVYLKSEGSYEAAGEAYRDILTADEDGFAQSKELPYGLYTVHQIAGWEDYEFISDFDVYISKNKTYKYLINNNAFESYIKITKYDKETGNMIPVANAGYEIYDDNGNKITMKYMYPEITETDVFYTNSEGWLITPEKLKIGDYTIVEVAAPYGYVLDSTPVKFRITKAATEQSGGQTVISVSQKNIPQKGIITINKSGDILKSVLKTENGYAPLWETAALEGAEFDIIAAEDIVTPEGTLRCKKGDVVAHVVTNAEGKAVSGELYLGKYLIKETKAPEGFLKAEDKEIEITYAGETVVVTEQSVSITDERQKVSVSLVKKLENSEDDVTKVVFGLYAKEDIYCTDGTTIPAGELIESASPDAEGKVIFNSDIPFGRFYIKELETIEGYILDETEYEFDFSYAGEDVDIVEITVNEGKAVINNKKHEPPEVLAGEGSKRKILGIVMIAQVFIILIIINVKYIKKRKR